MTTAHPGGQATTRALLTTPFVSSWVGHARPAGTIEADPAVRVAGWAHWALLNLTPMTGNSDRPYTALALPGRFYDARGTGATMRPHLEIPARAFERARPDFPHRLAQMGNGLQFPWWIVPEVLAVKRALFPPASGSVADVASLLNEHRPELEAALAPLSAAAGRQWGIVERLLLESSDGLLEEATGGFAPQEVTDHLPAAEALNLSVHFDTKLRETNRGRASRRVGVWTVRGTGPNGDFQLGVITPRLTRSSMFSDPLFDAATESPAALLVRALVLRRLLRTQLGGVIPAPAPAGTAGTGANDPHLRAVVARVGEKLPEASARAAIYFVQTHPRPEDAWSALNAWADTVPAGATQRRATLTVTEDAFVRAHTQALRAVRRAEDPDRADIDRILPLAWDSSSRVVRVTFNRAPDTEATETR